MSRGKRKVKEEEKSFIIIANKCFVLYSVKHFTCFIPYKSKA